MEGCGVLPLGGGAMACRTPPGVASSIQPQGRARAQGRRPGCTRKARRASTGCSSRRRRAGSPGIPGRTRGIPTRPRVERGDDHGLPARRAAIVPAAERPRRSRDRSRTTAGLDDQRGVQADLLVGRWGEVVVGEDRLEGAIHVSVAGDFGGRRQLAVELVGVPELDGSLAPFQAWPFGPTSPKAGVGRALEMVLPREIEVVQAAGGVDRVDPLADLVGAVACRPRS